MNKPDREQLFLIYDYMKLHGKFLKPLVTCNICHKNSYEVDFGDWCTVVCTNCYSKYRKLTRRERKGLLNDKRRFETISKQR